ncbi:hypothetical protein NC651_039351 [Populus alba x Populus x berolinensis]|nr:hypothetical protein NC651_039351 [Populus alba x Populus x berolinensis]
MHVVKSAPSSALPKYRGSCYLIGLLPIYP